MLQHLGRQIILPQHRRLMQETGRLEQLARAFEDAPDAAGLQAMRRQWKETAAVWRQVELYEFGPAMEDFVHYKIFRRPVRRLKIERYIKGGKALDSVFIANIATTAKGLPSIEYLIFPSDKGEAVLPAFEGDGGGRRREYLHALCLDLHKTASDLYESWDPEAGDYLSVFGAADSTGNHMQGSISLLANQMVVLHEGIVRFRLSEPLGLGLGGVPQPGQVEARRSAFSLELLRHNLEGFALAFTGGAGPGFDDYLDYLHSGPPEEALSARIKNQIDAVRRRLDAVDMPLHLAVIERTGRVKELHDEFSRLLVLLKVDMVNVLGVTITFSKYDGD